MKQLLLSLVLVSLSVSVNGMYTSGTPLKKDIEEFHEKLPSDYNIPVQLLHSTPKTVTPKYLENLVKGFGESIKELELFNARDENGFNILHHLASKGATRDDENVNYLIGKDVSLDGIPLKDGTQSPSFDELVDSFEGDRSVDGQDAEDFVEGEMPVARRVDFGEGASFNDGLDDLESETNSFVSTGPLIIEENKEKVIGSKGVSNAHDEEGFDLKGKESYTIQHGFWAAIATIAVGLMYKKYVAQGERSKLKV